MPGPSRLDLLTYVYDCIGYVIIATFTMTSNLNNQHTSQTHKAQETQAQPSLAWETNYFVTASVKGLDVLGLYLV